MIKVKEENTIYLRQEKTYIIDFHGLIFHINKWSNADEQFGDYEVDYEITETEEYEKLTDEKKDELDDFINDLV